MTVNSHRKGTMKLPRLIVCRGKTTGTKHTKKSNHRSLDVENVWASAMHAFRGRHMRKALMITAHADEINMCVTLPTLQQI